MPRDWRTNNARANAIRENLIAIYGAACAQCGCTNCHLEVNHIYGRDYKPSKLNRYCRFLRYFKEAKAGGINLLCPDCNVRYRPRRDAQPPGHCEQFAAWLQRNQQPF